MTIKCQYCILEKMKKEQLKKVALGLTIMFVPGAGVVAGSYLIYKALKKQKVSGKSFIDELKEEYKNQKDENK